MSKKNILIVVLSLLFLFAASVYAGRVDLTTYYPAPYGDYTNLTSTGASNFSTLSGLVGIGVTAANTRTRLHVAGQIYQDSAGTRMMFKTADGSCTSCGPNDSNVWLCGAVACP